MIFGLGAAGRAGKASDLGMGEARAEAAGVVEVEPLGLPVLEERLADGGGADAAHGVEEGATDRRDDDPTEAERGGNRVADDEGRAPLRPTAERDDCAVDDFRRSTRLPPVLTVPGDTAGNIPPEPGRAG